MSSLRRGAATAGLLVLLLCSLQGCGHSAGQPGPGAGVAGQSGLRGGAADAPAGRRRVVSLDYCADQFVLALVDRGDILRVSPDATADYSYLRQAARGLPSVRPRAEDVLVLRPDVVVRSYGGGPNARRFLEAAGVEVVQIGFASDIAAVRRNVREVAEALDVPERGRTLVADMDRRLAAIDTAWDPVREVLYLTPGGVTAGPGTLIHGLFEAAGLRNFQREPGWHSLPLERLAYEQPDLLAPAFFEARGSEVNHWTPSRHPVARRQMRRLPAVPLKADWVACGGWFLVDAVEALAQSPAPPSRTARRAP